MGVRVGGRGKCQGRRGRSGKGRIWVGGEEGLWSRRGRVGV